MRPAAILTSARLDLDVLLPVDQLGQRTAEPEGRRRAARLFGGVEHALVAVLLGQARQPIDVQVNLFVRWLAFN